MEKTYIDTPYGKKSWDLIQKALDQYIEKDTKHNGWTNYATWRVNLEIIDGLDPREYFSNYDPTDKHGLAENLKDYAHQVIFECGECNENSLAGSYAYAFLSDVNWYEIATNMIEAFNEEEAEVSK